MYYGNLPAVVFTIGAVMKILIQDAIFIDLSISFSAYRLNFTFLLLLFLKILC